MAIQSQTRNGKGEEHSQQREYPVQKLNELLACSGIQNKSHVARRWEFEAKGNKTRLEKEAGLCRPGWVFRFYHKH